LQHRVGINLVKNDKIISRAVSHGVGWGEEAETSLKCDKSLREFGRQWDRVRGLQNLKNTFFELFSDNLSASKNNHILNLYFIGYTLRHTWTASNVRTTDPSSKTTSNPCIPTTRPTLILAARVKRAGCQNDSVKIDLPPGNELENETKLLLITKWLKEERPS